MKALTRRVFGVFAAVAIAAVSGACSSASDSGQVDQPETIRLGAIATGSAPEEKVRYQQIADQLEAELGMPVDLVTSTDYYAIAEGLRGDHIDVAFLNSLGFVLTESKASIEPIAVGVDDTGRPGYYSFLVTNQPDEIKGPADVQGRTLALSGRLSTSGYLYPLRALQQAGLSPEEDTTLS